MLNFSASGLGALGHNQLAWLEANLTGRSASVPIVVFAHMPLWTTYEPWGLARRILSLAESTLA
jgi:hypothetical protein